MDSNSEYNENDYTIDDIIITHFINPSMFWYRISTDLSQELFNLERELFKHFSANRYKEYIPKEKEIVLLYVVSESRCCRAKVEEIFQYRKEPNKYMLWAMDHGKVYSSYSKFIRQLPQDLAEIQIENVFFGGLNNIVPAKQTFDYRRYDNVMLRCEKWSPETCRLFDEAVKDAFTLEFVIQRKVKDQFFGELRAAFQTNNRISINDMLIKSKGAMEESKNFVLILHELKLNQRSYVLTNENDISKFNQNTLNTGCLRVDKVESGMKTFRESEIKTNEEEYVIAENENKDEEMALNKKIKEWNLGNSKFPNENIEKVRKLQSVINENDIRDNMAKIDLKEDDSLGLQSTFSVKSNKNDSEKNVTNLEKGEEILNVNKSKLLVKDPFDEENLPLKLCDSGMDKKSVSGHSMESNESRKTAREKILDRVRNRNKKSAEIATKPKLIVPAGFDMRNIQQSKAEMVVKCKNDIIQTSSKRSQFDSFVSNTTDADSIDSSLTMTESVKSFLEKHASKESNYLTEQVGFQEPLSAFEIQPLQPHQSNNSPQPSTSRLISRDNKPLQQNQNKNEKTEFDKNLNMKRKNEVKNARSDNLLESGNNKSHKKSSDSAERSDNERRKSHFQKSEKKGHTYSKPNYKKEGFVELDETCIPTKTIGKDVMVHGIVPVPISRLAEAEFTTHVQNKMEMLGPCLNRIHRKFGIISKGMRIVRRRFANTAQQISDAKDGLIRHLSAVHPGNTIKCKANLEISSAFSKIFKIQPTIFSYNKRQSIAEIVARLCALDGFSISGTFVIKKRVR